jgi:hypothetical protein
LTGKPIFHKLIRIGKSSIKHGRGYAISCHFQSWSLIQNCPKDENLLHYEVNSAFAGSLICGTIWTNVKDQSRKIDNIPADNCIFSTGPDPLYVRKLKHIIEGRTLLPPGFWATHGDTWVISIKADRKTILIPYFELLRSLFYQTSRRLTDFIFSKTPLKFLCRPLAYPNRDNSFTARYCVAATYLTGPEARLLGCLLFDPEISYIFNTSQAYWLSSSSTNNTVFSEEAVINAGNFKDFHFSGDGYNLSNNNEQYFWVENLNILQYNYKFNKLLFHPITEGHNINPKDKETELPEISDLLQITKNYSQPSKIRSYMVSSSLKKATRVLPFKNKRNERHAIRKAGLLPLVTCMSSWAIKPIKISNYKYIDDKAFAQVICPVLNASTPITHTDAFQKIIDTFEEYDYPAKFLTINNSEQIFGEKISVFPIDKHTPLQGTIYKNRVQHFSLAEITLDNSIIYIAQPFPQTNPELTTLIIKQSLTQLDNAEWNEILADILPVYNEGDLGSFYKKINSRAGRTVAHNTAISAIPLPTNTVEVDFCLDLVEHIIDRFRKRLQFFLATSLRYPQGITQEQGKIIKKLSHNTCRVPDALWKTKILNYWSLKYLYQ